MENKYINPVHGKYGVFGGNKPAELTRAEVIVFAAEHCIGTCNGIEGEFDSFLEWLEETGSQKIDFRFDDLEIAELQSIDEIVFTCEGCGWNYEVGEKHFYNCDPLCDSCYDEIEYDDCWEDEEEEEEDDF